MAPPPRPTPSARQQRAWLDGEPPIAEVRARFPDEWAQVRRELAEVVETAKAAQREVLELKDSRRYRLGRALAAPLDRLRGKRD